MDVMKQCKYCDQIFNGVDFVQHECGYTDRESFVFDDQMMNFLWEDSPLCKLYQHNSTVMANLLDKCDGAADRLKDANKLAVQTNQVCLVCHRTYVHASGLARHMKTQHNSNNIRLNPFDWGGSNDAPAEVIKCLVCGQIFISLTMCFAHLKLMHAEYGVEESEQSLDVGDTKLFGKQLLEYAFQCEFCDFVFADTSDLFQHKMSHDISIGYACSSCELASRNVNFILNHRNNECPYEMYEHHRKIACKVLFVCNECESTYASLAELYEHR